MSGPRITKSCELAVCVNGAVVSEKSINLSREICINGLTDNHLGDKLVIMDAEVSRRHSNRGNERGVG